MSSLTSAWRDFKQERCRTTSLLATTAACQQNVKPPIEHLSTTTNHQSFIRTAGTGLKTQKSGQRKWPKVTSFAALRQATRGIHAIRATLARPQSPTVDGVEVRGNSARAAGVGQNGADSTQSKRRTWSHQIEGATRYRHNQMVVSRDFKGQAKATTVFWLDVLFVDADAALTCCDLLFSTLVQHCSSPLLSTDVQCNPLVVPHGSRIREE